MVLAGQRSLQSRGAVSATCSSCVSTSELCKLCRGGWFDQLKGVAACRGEVWADELARDPKLARLPWPIGSEKVTTIARTKVADLTHDPELLELLAGELAKWAERRWATAPARQAAASCPRT